MIYPYINKGEAKSAREKPTRNMLKSKTQAAAGARGGNKRGLSGEKSDQAALGIGIWDLGIVLQLFDEHSLERLKKLLQVTAIVDAREGGRKDQRGDSA